MKLLNKRTGRFIEEQWKPLKGFEDKYIISNTGEVARMKRNWYGEMEKEYVQQHYDKDGYLRVTLIYNSKKFGRGVHRLVAENFLSNPKGKPEVDHINTIRDCNVILNLKWVTRKENQNNPLTKAKRKNK